MPELPEVETIKRYMENQLSRQVIDRIEIRQYNLRYDCSDLSSLELPAKINVIRRRAKYIILDLDNACSTVVHLGMSGRLTLMPESYILKKHDHIIMHLKSGSKLVYNDARRFGMVKAFVTVDLDSHKIFKNLGVEPLSSSFTTKYLQSKFARRSLPIKNALMDNRIIVGVGNIYAVESLFLAKIDPRRGASSLSQEEIERLIIHVKNVLKKAIEMGGTTLRDFVNGDNSPGYFKQKLMVYARNSEKCIECGSSILKIKQSGRSTYFCPTCQK